MSTPSHELFDSHQEPWLERVDPNYVNSLPYLYAKNYSVLALFRDEGSEKNRNHVLCSDRPDLGVINELRRKLNGPLLFHQTDQPTFERMLRQAYDKGQSEATQMVDDLGDEFNLERLAHELPESTDLLETGDEAPIIRLINALLTQAIREGASDIHLEAFEERSVVRFRVDGVLRDVVEPQRALHGALAARVKVMASLDIAEKRLPQDGRISIRVGDHPVDVRVSTHGERIVLRLLDKTAAMLDIEQLGMEREMRAQFDSMIHKPHGILLVTGPTGSGKTTTLYAGLTRLDRQSLNILTVEDPVEYDLDSVGQTQVNAKIGLTFASGLRSILRQDPDVVLVGEIRDLETAQIAVQSSLTGHLVLSTLHTNTAIGAVTRLLDMGMESFLISSSILGVLSQRLVRKLCASCAQPYPPGYRERQLLGLTENDDIEIYRSVGCAVCENTGFRGRTGIYELIPVDDHLRTMIHEQASEEEMLDYVRRTVKGISQSGFDKVLAGVTNVDEVLRVSIDS